MKKFYLLIIFGIILIFASCADSATSDANMMPQVIMNPEDTTTIVETEPPFVIETADELYDLIIANKSVWERSGMVSGTLIDLDYTGTPEFILIYGADKGFQRDLSIFKFDGEIMKEIKSIENIYAEGYYAEFRAIVPYTDDNGVKRWLIPYAVNGDEYLDYYFSAFDFAGDEIDEYVKFNCKIKYADHSREGYYGYEYLHTEFYIDGVEHTASQDKIDAFMAELDKYITEAEQLEAEGYVGATPWYCGQFFPNPSQAEWEEIKLDFLNNTVAAQPAYNLFPGVESEYIDYNNNKLWSDDANIEKSVKKLTTAYIDNDESYLRTDNLFYKNDGAMCKPVIYLYPTEPTDVKVRVTFPYGVDFTCTYPDYGNGWDVTAYPDGTVINKADGLEYSYLYWEAEGYSDWDLSSGFVVKGSDTAAFLREKLAYLGLTPREYNEFIVYWLPLMQINEYNLITFQTTAYEESTNLYVSPRPDSMQRVFMAYQPLDEAISISEQVLEPFERTGFSVIEWGGTCVDQDTRF